LQQADGSFFLYWTCGIVDKHFNGFSKIFSSLLGFQTGYKWCLNEYRMTFQNPQ